MVENVCSFFFVFALLLLLLAQYFFANSVRDLAEEKKKPELKRIVCGSHKYFCAFHISHSSYIFNCVQMGNIYAYYSLTYARARLCVCVCLRISNNLCFVYFSTYSSGSNNGIRRANDIKYFTYALSMCYAFHIPSDGIHVHFEMSMRQNPNNFIPALHRFIHIKLLNFTPSRVSYHGIKSIATTHILFSFSFTISMLHFILEAQSYLKMRMRKKTNFGRILFIFFFFFLLCFFKRHRLVRYGLKYKTLNIVRVKLSKITK